MKEKIKLRIQLYAHGYGAYYLNTNQLDVVSFKKTTIYFTITMV